MEQAEANCFESRPDHRKPNATKKEQIAGESMVVTGRTQCFEVPGRFVVSLIRWVIRATEPEEPVRSILRNDLFKTCRSCSRAELLCLRDSVTHTINNFPDECRERLNIWSGWGGLEHRVMPKQVRSKVLKEFQPFRNQSPSQVRLVISLLTPGEVLQLETLLTGASLDILKSQQEK